MNINSLPSPEIKDTDVFITVINVLVIFTAALIPSMPPPPEVQETFDTVYYASLPALTPVILQGWQFCCSVFDKTPGNPELSPVVRTVNLHLALAPFPMSVISALVFLGCIANCVVIFIHSHEPSVRGIILPGAVALCLGYIFSVYRLYASSPVQNGRHVTLLIMLCCLIACLSLAIIAGRQDIFSGAERESLLRIIISGLCFTFCLLIGYTHLWLNSSVPHLEQEDLKNRR